MWAVGLSVVALVIILLWVVTQREKAYERQQAQMEQLTQLTLEAFKRLSPTPVQEQTDAQRQH